MVDLNVCRKKFSSFSLRIDCNLFFELADNRPRLHFAHHHLLTCFGATLGQVVQEEELLSGQV